MNVNEITPERLNSSSLLCTGAPPHHSYCLDHHRVPEQVHIPCRNRLLEAIGMPFFLHNMFSRKNAPVETLEYPESDFIWPFRGYLFIGLDTYLHILSMGTKVQRNNEYPNLLCLTDKYARKWCTYGPVKECRLDGPLHLISLVGVGVLSLPPCWVVSMNIGPVSMAYGVPTVKSSLTIIIVMSNERPSKNNPMRKIAGSLQTKLSSLLRLSRAPTSSLIEIDPSSDNNIATSNAGTRWATEWPCLNCY